jgi:hypothetical protein
MRWLRLLRGRSDGPSRADALAELDLALHDPERHTWALVVASETQESPEYVRARTALEKWPPRRWLRLDAVRLDAWTSYDAEFALPSGWSASLDKADASTLLLVLASTHRDGFLRERATRLLAERAGLIPSAALAVRAVDPVAQVREVARPALQERKQTADAEVIVPILLATRQREVATNIFEDYVEGLSAEVLRLLVRSEDNETRRFAIERAPLSPTELVQIAVTDADTRSRLTAARRAIAQDEAVADDLLAVRPATVRALAVSVAAEGLVRPRLEQLLLDRSALLRRAAQSRAWTLGVDAAELYRNHLPARVAILGVGETGSGADVDGLTRFVSGEQAPSVRRAVVRALGRLASREFLLALLPPLLEADQPSLAREASRQLRRHGFTLAGPDLDRLLASPYVWTRQAALALAHGRRAWDALVAALKLYDDPDENLRENARSALGTWLSRQAASAGRPTSEQADQLCASLERASLAPELARLIRFHGDL